MKMNPWALWRLEFCSVPQMASYIDTHIKKNEIWDFLPPSFSNMRFSVLTQNFAMLISLLWYPQFADICVLVFYIHFLQFCPKMLPSLNSAVYDTVECRGRGLTGQHGQWLTRDLGRGWMSPLHSAGVSRTLSGRESPSSRWIWAFRFLFWKIRDFFFLLH